MADTHAAANNFLNALERIPGIIDQYREKNGILEKEIPRLQEITGKEWKKEDKLKRLKTELAVLERRIQLDFRTGTDAGGQTTPGIPDGQATVSASMLSGTTGTLQFSRGHVQTARKKPVEENEPGKDFKL